MRRALLVTAVLAGCGGGRQAAPPPRAIEVPPPVIAAVDLGPDAGVSVVTALPAPPARWRVTLVGATLEPSRPDGRDWDSGERIDSDAPGVRSLMASYLTAHPELEQTRKLTGDVLATPILRKEATKSIEPDAYVFVQVGGELFRSPLVQGSFAPVWSFPMLLTAAPGDRRSVHVTVCDWDGSFAYEVMGEADVPLGDLVAGRFKWVRAGTVSGLTFSVEPAGPPIDKRVAVRAKVTWHDTGVDIVAGQRMHLEAAGELCSKSGSKCAGPEGQQATSSYSLEGMKELPHAALVASLGDTRFYVGRDLSFVAPSSGRLLLGLNDQETDDNSGFFDVRIRAD